jgi:phosphohistidine swiveling domain-containing protein
MFKITNNIEKFKPLIKERWDIQGLSAVPSFIHAGPECGILGMNKIMGFGFTKFMMQFKKDYIQLYYNRDDMHKCFEKFYKKYKKDKTYMTFLMNVEEELGDDLYEYIRYIKPRLYKLNDKELIKAYKKLFTMFSSSFNTSHIIECIALTTDVTVKDMLMKELEKKKITEKSTEYFTLLTQPSEIPFVIEHDNNIAKILELIRKSKNKSILDNLDEKENNKLNQLIEDHISKFFWYNTTWVGGKYITKPELIKELKQYIENNDSFNFVDVKKYQQMEKDKNKLLKKLKLSQELTNLLEITSKATYWQDLRKIKMLKGILALQRFVSEISSRTEIKEENLKYLLIKEEGDKLNDVFKDIKTKSKAIELDKLLAERRKGSMYLYMKNELMIESGKEYDNLLKNMKKQKSSKEVKEISGMCASTGRVIGKVKICLKPNDLKKFKSGEILVTSMTRPEFVPVMKKAVAIITDEGGLTCHAAIVSRELKKPCIIGTKIATKVLKNGMVVEVNANHSIVKIL